MRGLARLETVFAWLPALGTKDWTVAEKCLAVVVAFNCVALALLKAADVHSDDDGVDLGAGVGAGSGADLEAGADTGADAGVGGSVGPTPGEVHRSYARRWRRGSWWRLEAYALQGRSRSLIDVFARAASGGRSGWATLRTELARSLEGRPRAQLRSAALDPRPLRSIARMLANQPASATDSSDASLVYAVLAEQHPLGLTDIDRYLYLEVASSQEDGAYRRVLRTTGLGDADPAHVACVAANRVADPGSRDWAETVSSSFLSVGLEPISVLPGHDQPFDRLVATTRQLRSGGPLVSVIVPTFEPDGRLHTAVRALLGQSWQELEILIVDDGSSPSARALVAAIAEQDARIRVVTHERRHGTYAARNSGLAAARGELVTCHDDDDWSHPRKVETQVDALLEDSVALGCMSRHVRATEGLRFTRVNVNACLPQPNFSSIMVRRNVLLERFGGWDEARKGSDAELKERLEAASGVSLPVVGDVPLSFTRSRVGSVSFGQLARGHVDPARVAQRLAYRHWHSTLDADWRLPDTGTRPFPLSASFEHAGRLDLTTVLLADFRSSGPSLERLVSRVSQQLGTGTPVGLLHLESPWVLTDPALREEYWTLIERGAHLVTLGDLVGTRDLIIIDPATVQFLDRTPCRVTADSVILLPDEASGAPRFDVGSVEANAHRLFGGHVRWSSLDDPPESEDAGNAAADGTVNLPLPTV